MGACFSAVHNDQLFVHARTTSQGCIVLRTSDMVTWHTLPPPPNTLRCTGLVSHNHHLYYVSLAAQDMTIYKLEESHGAESTHATSTASPWIKLPNSRCSRKHSFAAVFQSGNLLVLAGGTNETQGESVSAIAGYCLESHQWISPTQWPSLPFPATRQHPVLLEGYLHLLGGLVFKGGMMSNSPDTVLSMKTRHGRPSGEWQSTFIPATPHHTCGACRLFGTIAVAGGGCSFNKKYHSDVYVFNKESCQWLKLPPLTKPRGFISLVFFKDRLLAFGGNNLTRGGWQSTAEQLLLPLQSS